MGWKVEADMYRKTNKKRRIADAGFTLLEALMAVFLVGCAVVALVMSTGYMTKVNAAGVDISTAEFLMEQMRERVAMLSYADLAALGTGSPYSPPIDINGTPTSGYSTFTQQVTVQEVRRSDLSTLQSGSDFSRITVSVLNNGASISTATWIRTDMD